MTASKVAGPDVSISPEVGGHAGPTQAALRVWRQLLLPCAMAGCIMLARSDDQPAQVDS